MMAIIIIIYTNDLSHTINILFQKPTNIEKAIKVIDILVRKWNETTKSNFLMCLRETGQNLLADMIEEGLKSYEGTLYFYPRPVTV